MAGKKNNTETEIEIEEYDPEKIRKRIAKEIEKSLGSGIIVSGNEIIERPRTIIPVSPRIDSIIGGGIPEGSWVVLSGNPKCGKTLTSLHFAKKCQMEEYGNRNVYYLNVEGRLKKRDIVGIPGIKADKLTVIESTEDKILSTQDYLSTAEKILYTDKKCLLIIDSISQLCEEREHAGGMGTETRGGGAKLVSQFTRQMGNVVPVKNSIIICILHLGANTSGYGSPVFEKGGNSIQYQVDVKLRAQGDAEPWALTKGANPFGQVVTWHCKSAALGPPGRKTESYIRYGEGIDEVTELFFDAKDVGLISGDSYFTFEFLKDHIKEDWNDKTIKELGAKPHGQHAARKALMENKEWFDWLKEDLKGLI